MDSKEDIKVQQFSIKKFEVRLDLRRKAMETTYIES
jgi:hypothetical protein